jgi:4-amino-4-deoxychorismate lyase
MLVNGKHSNSISIRDRGLLYGDGVFRTLLVRNHRALFWQQHYQKLLHDCTALGIICPEFTLLSKELDSLLSQHPAAVIKLIVTRGEGARGYAPTKAVPTHLWDIAPLPDYPDDYVTQGIKVHLCRLRLGQQPRLAGIKHLNRLENVLAAAECSATQAVEGLLLDTKNNVIEATRSNLFLVSQGQLITPDLSNCGVAGVQRDRVIAWAQGQNKTVQIRNVTLDEVMSVDELFLTNSIIGLWSIRELEQQCWTDFPVATQIRQALLEE